MQALERPQATQRRNQGRPQKTTGKFPEVSSADRTANETRTKVGVALGTSGRTHHAMKAVTEAAEKDPEAFGAIAQEMNDILALVSRDGDWAELSGKSVEVGRLQA